MPVLLDKGKRQSVAREYVSNLFRVYFIYFTFRKSRDIMNMLSALVMFCLLLIIIEADVIQIYKSKTYAVSRGAESIVHDYYLKNHKNV